MATWLADFLLLMIAVGVWFCAFKTEATADLLADIKGRLEDVEG
jgi:hypothetical protein